ncbi:hypothetical protein EDD22DRAFT_960365 [Suillus occidentalis]|nr:hypothetical protein EDD22DRAFT_960365 [Suillus occidentalis]
MSNSSTYELTEFTIFNATNILEYATSRFAAIWIACNKSQVPWLENYTTSFVRHLQWEANSFVFPYITICMVLNIHPTMPDLLHSILSRFSRLHTGNITRQQFYKEFFEHCCPYDPQLRSTHRVVANYAHDWWKDHFDVLQLSLPSIDVSKVMDMTIDHFDQLPLGAMLQPSPTVTSQVDGKPCLNQILAVKACVQHLSKSLTKMLEEKIQMATDAADAISKLEGPMSELEEALLNSRWS